MRNSFLHPIFHINKRRTHYLKKMLADTQLSGSMYLVLNHISEYKGSSQDDIANSHDIDKATIAREARKLEDMGLIVRTSVPDNRRQYTLETTEKGEEMAERINLYDEKVIEVITSGISKEELKQLSKLMEKMDKNSEALEHI